MPDAFPIFRPRQFGPPRKSRRSERFRGSARDRGYDARWDRISLGHRRRYPFCVLCEQRGRTVLADDVDHVIPLVDGGDKYARENRQSLCRDCHNGLKRAMEQFARKTGQVDRLPDWCLKPETRPPRFRAL